MNRTTFFKHFDLLADQPDAVAKMRELIFQLAVRGQLVEQSGKDEPAHKLADRARKAWPERKNRDREKSEAQEPPHKLPAGWVWTCLDEIGDTNPRNEANDKLEVGFVPMKLISAGYGKPVSFEVKPWGEVKKGFTHFADGDVVLAKITPCFENGKSAVIPRLKNGIGAGTTELHVFRQYSGCVLPDYVLIFFKTPTFINEGVPRMTGSAGQKRVPWDYFANTPFPLPPLAEQRRIVAKVDELMALCDELEQRQQARQHASGILQQSALHHLLAAREPQTFAAAWQRVRDHFHLLHDTPAAIPQLRQAILQLAVQGRLVPQNPKEVPGHELLARIKNERERLLKIGRLKNGTNFAPLAQAEIPIQLPSGWTAARFIEIAEIVGGVTKGRNLAGRDNASFPYLRVANVQRGFVDVSIMKEIEIPKEELLKYRLIKNDLLIVEGGDWDKVGRMAIWDGQIENCIHQNHIFRARFWNTDLLPRWITLFSNSKTGREYFERASKQTTNLASINMSQLRLYPIPIPPLAEQKRIVARVEELLRWCDTLEAQLQQTRTLGTHLLASTLHHLLADNKAGMASAINSERGKR